eukprot:TRINITY_DN565_c0_g1_i1.p1 TRINITY_DN565_c0_g1~~TRINITY_DN565_c0_g1_i1.p1  ORF type:complete len:177 (+),score=14.77 TRINITY_DN565_c0_g1_i1:23-532(+)
MKSVVFALCLVLLCCGAICLAKDTTVDQQQQTHSFDDGLFSFLAERTIGGLQLKQDKSREQKQEHAKRNDTLECLIKYSNSSEQFCECVTGRSDNFACNYDCTCDFYKMSCSSSACKATPGFLTLMIVPPSVCILCCIGGCIFLCVRRRRVVHYHVINDHHHHGHHGHH